jgi:long-chain acyl-CoA synthetase
MKCTRYFDPYLNGLSVNPKKIALGGKKGGVWKTLTYEELEMQALELSNGLLHSGFEKGDKVITISGNNPECFVIDFAVCQIGGIHVPIYPNYNTEDFTFVIAQCAPKIIFVSGQLTKKLVQEIIEELGLKANVVLIEVGTTKGLKKLQRSVTAKEKDRIYALRDAITAEDIYSIYYTSGTGGGPKGAVYKHGSIGMIYYIGEVIQASAKDISLSYLPMSHAYERPHILTMLNEGASVYFATSTSSIIENLQEVKPSFMTTVPILLEKVLDIIVDKASAIPEAQQAGYLKLVEDAKKQNIAVFYKGESSIAGHPIAQKWKGIFGNNLRLISSAGAPLSTTVNQFFHAIGIPILECYGLTEIGMGTYNAMPDKVKCGSVGPAAKDIEIKLSPIDNEILIKSPYVTKEIYKIPELTATLTDEEGYFRSGDIGEIDEDGFIYINGRKKEIFKLKNGRYFTPVTVENLLKQSPLIDNVVLFEQEGTVSCIVNPSSALNKELSIDEKLAILWAEVGKLYNNSVTDIERINRLNLDESEWTIENGKLTPTLKVKRFKVINN